MAIEFSYRAHHSYKEYLAQQYMKENMDVVISKNIREAVGSIEDIYASNLKDLKRGIDDNFEVVTLNLEQMSESLDVINSNLVAGFQALFVKVEELNASLAHLSRGIDTLIDIARTPVQTWAYNQFEIAQDMVRRRLYPEALEALGFAIDGRDQHTGYKSEFRFHYLRGVMRAGIPGEPESAELIELGSAEESFLLAARYARHDHPTEAAQAFVGAGKVAYAADHATDAERYYRDALKLDDDCGEATYQLARVKSNDVQSVARYLCNAFECHWSFAMRAAADPLFSGNAKLEETVRKCTRLVAEGIADKAKKKVEGAIAIVERFRTMEFPTYPIANLEQFKEIDTWLRSALRGLQFKQLQPIFDLNVRIDQMIPRMHRELVAAVEYYCKATKGRRSEIIRDEVNALTAEELRTWKQKSRRLMIVGVAAVAAISGWFIYLSSNPLACLGFAAIGFAICAPFYLVMKQNFYEAVSKGRMRDFDDRMSQIQTLGAQLKGQSGLLGNGRVW